MDAVDRSRLHRVLRSIERMSAQLARTERTMTRAATVLNEADRRVSRPRPAPASYHLDGGAVMDRDPHHAYVEPETPQPVLGDDPGEDRPRRDG